MPKSCTRCRTPKKSGARRTLQKSGSRRTPKKSVTRRTPKRSFKKSGVRRTPKRSCHKSCYHGQVVPTAALKLDKDERDHLKAEILKIAQGITCKEKILKLQDVIWHPDLGDHALWKLYFFLQLLSENECEMPETLNFSNLEENLENNLDSTLLKPIISRSEKNWTTPQLRAYDEALKKASRKLYGRTKVHFGPNQTLIFDGEADDTRKDYSGDGSKYYPVEDDDEVEDVFFDAEGDVEV